MTGSMSCDGGLRAGIVGENVDKGSIVLKVDSRGF